MGNYERDGFVTVEATMVRLVLHQAEFHVVLVESRESEIGVGVFVFGLSTI